MVQILHAFVSGKPASNDATKVDGPKWDAAHDVIVSATDRILGRVSAGAGAVEEIPFTDAGQALLALASTRGDLIRGGVAAWERLVLGTSGYHLQSDGTDAAWAGFLPAGAGASTRSWQAKGRERRSIADFGAVGDATAHPLSEFYGSLAAAQARYPFVTSLTQTIDWAALVAAQNAVDAAGGGIVHLGALRLVIRDTFFAKPTVFFEGEGAFWSDSSLSDSRANSATHIIWDSATAGDVMVAWQPSGADDDTAVVPRGGGMRNVLIDGRGVATACVQILSWVGLSLENVHAIEAVATTGVGWYMGTYTAGATPGKYSSCYHKLVNCSYLDGGNESYALAMWGANELYNTCFCAFFGCFFRGKTARAISIGDADSNFFSACAWGGNLVFEAGSTTGAGGTSPFSVGSYFAARNNVIKGSQGLVTAKEATSGSRHSFGNEVDGYQIDLSGVLPTIEAGAILTVRAFPDGTLNTYGFGTYGETFMGLRVALAATQSIANETTTAIQWPNDPSHDFLDLFSNAQNTRVTVANGISRARLGLSVDFDANVNGERYIEIRKNGATIVARATSWAMDSSLPTTLNVDTGVLTVVPGDYFEGRAYQSSGGALNLLNITTYMTMDVL